MWREGDDPEARHQAWRGAAEITSKDSLYAKYPEEGGRHLQLHE